MLLNTPVMIDVSENDIAYAEKILLGVDKHFDDERLRFIKDFATLDLQAVPGSGKTTALLAKLLILETKLPLINDRAVLVLSHTNTAIDEIKSRIGKYCPKLFSYPHFIGTIQSFVDVFLAIPCYTNKFKQKPYRIDNEIYDEQVEKFYDTTRNVGLRNYLDRQRDGITFLKSIRLNTELNLISYLNGNEENFKIKNKETKTYISLKNFKINLLENGYLHFDDAYFLAEYMISNTPNCINVIRQRFNYIFIDEMQDMDLHQYNLLEKIFFRNEDPLCSIQRVGDINQAIFNGFSDSEGVWSYRDNIKYINGSYRLSPKIASIVEKLALTPNPIEGRNTNLDGSEIQIKPTIIIYNNENKGNIIEFFANKISKLINEDLIPNNEENTYQVVAWRKEHPDDDKIGLKDYCPNYNEISIKTKIDYRCLNDYLMHFDKEKRTLESIRKNILNAFLRILRIENIKDENDRFFTKKKLINKIKSLSEVEYEKLKLNLYKWSIGVIKSDNTIINEIRRYIPEFLIFFDKAIGVSLAFINNESEHQPNQEEGVQTNNNFNFEGLDLQVGTVHSVKGQTNTASLYLETFFGRGYGNYESERLRHQILGDSVSDTLNTNVSSKEKIKKSAKMAYVGFSRPTHFLCVGIHKDRFDSCITEIDRTIWDVIEI
ncbi:UvrD-helicase domain-containing protein [Bacteroidota bacterium]